VYPLLFLKSDDLIFDQGDGLGDGGTKDRVKEEAFSVGTNVVRQL